MLIQILQLTELRGEYFNDHAPTLKDIKYQIENKKQMCSIP